MASHDAVGTHADTTLADIRKKIGYIPDSAPDDDASRKLTGRQWAKFYIDVGRQAHKLGGSAALVYLALLSHAFATRRVWPSHERLSELTGLKLTAVKKALKRLRDLRLYTPGQKEGRANSYILR